MAIQDTGLFTELTLAGCGNGCGQPGLVVVYYGPISSSGRTATVNLDWYDPSVVAGGDITGDGRPDFVVQSEQSNATGLYFGVHDADATTSDGGGFMPLGDLNGDGRADFLVGSQFYFGSAHPFDHPGTLLAPGL